MTYQLLRIPNMKSLILLPTFHSYSYPQILRFLRRWFNFELSKLSPKSKSLQFQESLFITWLQISSDSTIIYLALSSVQFSHSVVSNSLQLHGLQHASLPCPSPARRACSNSCPLSQWCLPIISSSVVPFSFCLQSFPASGSFSVSQFFPSGGQSIETSASASVLPMNTFVNCELRWWHSFGSWL